MKKGRVRAGKNQARALPCDPRITDDDDAWIVASRMLDESVGQYQHRVRSKERACRQMRARRQPGLGAAGDPSAFAERRTRPL